MATANFNPNSYNAISTGSDQFGLNYLETAVIPNFQFNGKSNFTLGTFVYIDEDVANASIYKQGTAFDIGFDNLNLYFKSPFCSFSITTEQMSFQLKTWYYISLSYDGENVYLYLNGLKVISFPAKAVTQNMDNTDYNIGYNFHGLMKSVFVYNCCLTDEEILNNFVNSFCKTDKIIAWFDFTGIQIHDKSSNNIAVHLGAGLVVIDNRTHCLDLTNQGYVQLGSKTTINQGYTFLTKLYPEDVNGCVFSNADLNYQSGFYITLKHITDDTYKVLCNINSAVKGTVKIISQTTFNIGEWVDIGVTYESGKAVMYVNGTVEGSADGLADTDMNGNGSQTIGAYLWNNNPDNYFNGYVSHVSEFDRVLNADEFNKYIANPPYLFSNKIKSLFFFTDSLKVERVSGIEFSLKENAMFNIITKTQMSSVSNSVTIEVSNDGCKKWENYNKNEQWEIQLFATTIGSYLDIAGISSVVTEDWYKQPVVAKYFNNASKNNPAFNSLVSKGMNVTNSDITAFLAASIIVIADIGILFSTLAGAKTAVSVSSIASVLSSAAMSELLLKGLCAAAVIGLAVLIVKLVLDEFFNRPTPPSGDVTVLLNGINFIIDGNAANSAINITKDGTTPISAENQDAACYVLNKIKPIPEIQISVTCVYASKSPINAVLIGTESIIKDGKPETSGKLLGDIRSDKFTISMGETKTITVKLPNNKIKTPFKISNTTTNWYWTCECDGKAEFLKNSEQKIFTLLDIPQAPWKYQEEGTNLPWSDIMDIAANWINKDNNNEVTDDLICEKLTVGVNECGLKLNNDTGAPAYIENPTAENGNLKINLYNFNKDYRSDPKTMPENGCSSIDCSLLLATLSRLHGIAMSQVTFSGGSFNQGFHTNKVIPIGYTEWVQPYANARDPIGFLGYHCVGIRGDAMSNWYNLNVYDSCFKLDNGSGNAVLPVKKGLAALTSGQKVSEVDTASYRGQLVKQGEISYILMPITTTWELQTEKPKDPEPDTYIRNGSFGGGK